MKKTLTFLIWLGLAWPNLAQASNTIAPIESPAGRISQPEFSTNTYSNINPILAAYGTRILDVVYVVLTGLAIAMLIYSGIQYITAGHSMESAKKARQNLVNVFLGVILLVASYFIINAIWSLATNLAGNINK